MAIFGMPYASDKTENDRQYTSAQQAKANAVMGTSGLAWDQDASAGLVEKIAGTRQVTIQPCEALIAGHKCISDEVETLTLDAGHGTYPRIDTIVFESNANVDVRAPRFAIVQGQPSSDPTPAELSSTPALTQVPLARILVPAGANSLDSATITDARVWVRGKHKHEIADINNLGTQLAGKSDTGHTHTSLASVSLGQAQVTGDAPEKQARVVNIYYQKTSDPLPSGAVLAALPAGTLILRYEP